MKKVESNFDLNVLMESCPNGPGLDDGFLDDGWDKGYQSLQSKVVESKQPTSEEVDSVIKKNIFVSCPQMLIDALNDSFNPDWLSMHDTKTDDDDEMPPEIYQYYLVDGWFGRGLEGIGRCNWSREYGYGGVLHMDLIWSMMRWCLM